MQFHQALQEIHEHVPHHLRTIKHSSILLSRVINVISHASQFQNPLYSTLA